MATNTVTITDPTVTNDSSQGFAAGSIWTNLSNGKAWVCTDATAGAAVWVVAASAQPSSLETTAGVAVGDNTLIHPVRTEEVSGPDILRQMFAELKAIRMILGSALNIDLQPEDIT